MKATIIKQSTAKTVVKCPTCHLGIALFHGVVGEPNDGFGYLNVGEQVVKVVVCMNRMSNGKYCQFSGSMNLV